MDVSMDHSMESWPTHLVDNFLDTDHLVTLQKPVCNNRLLLVIIIIIIIIDEWIQPLTAQNLLENCFRNSPDLTFLENKFKMFGLALLDVWNPIV